MQAYLAEKYMSGPKADAILAKVAPQKRKKKKGEKLNSASGAALGAIHDEDADWASRPNDADDDISEAVVEKDRSFKRRKQDGGEGAGWTTVREGPHEASGEASGSRSDEPAAPFSGGLVKSSDIKRVLPGEDTSHLPKSKEEREAMKAASETVYRDATGRRIDTKAERAEAARKKREREELEAKKMEWGKGLVQREEEARRKEQLEREKKRDLAVYADDKELNEEQRARDRWNDPAAAFLTKGKKKGPRKPEYTGPPPPPNRFGIKPGYRWDGVDRSNGFEKKLFQKTNERQRRGLESYQWSVDDM